MTTQIPETVDLSKYVETRLMGDRPHVRGRRLPVIFVGEAYDVNRMSISEIAYNFTITEEEVFAALLYYREHKAEIDAQMSRDQQDWLELKARNTRNGISRSFSALRKIVDKSIGARDKRTFRTQNSRLKSGRAETRYRCT